jgi:hypothetical protein
MTRQRAPVLGVWDCGCPRRCHPLSSSGRLALVSVGSRGALGCDGAGRQCFPSTPVEQEQVSSKIGPAEMKRTFSDSSLYLKMSCSSALCSGVRWLASVVMRFMAIIPKTALRTTSESVSIEQIIYLHARGKARTCPLAIECLLDIWQQICRTTVLVGIRHEVWFCGCELPVQT